MSRVDMHRMSIPASPGISVLFIYYSYWVVFSVDVAGDTDPFAVFGQCTSTWTRSVLLCVFFLILIISSTFLSSGWINLRNKRMSDIFLRLFTASSTHPVRGLGLRRHLKCV